MSKRLPQQQLTTVVFMLFEGLVDGQANCCRASSVILNTLLKNRGGGLQELVKPGHTHAWTFTHSQCDSCANVDDYNRFCLFVRLLWRL